MFHHMVMLRFSEGTTDEQIGAISDGLATLPEQIDGLLAYRFGPDAGVTDGSWDYAIQGDFATPDAYQIYNSHPAHQEVLTDWIRPVLDDVARVQFIR